MRPATMDDVAAVVNLINTCAQAATGGVKTTIEDKQNAWETPGLDITADTQLIFTPDNKLIGLVEFWDILEPHVQPTVHVHVCPEYDPQIIGDTLLRWADDRAQAVVDLAPPEAQVVLLCSSDGRDQAKQTLLQSNGYDEERIFWQMLLEMEDAPPSPIWPEKISSRTFVSEQDDRGVYDTIEAAFADHWRHVPIAYDQWRHWTLEDDEFDPSLLFLAWESGQTVGAIIAWPTYNDNDDTGFISDLGVRHAWRRQGIGKALLLQTFDAFFRRGIYKVALEVDTESLTGALRLYESVGMHPVNKRIVYEKVVRTGTT
ncbi:MAG: GNAT family N-acetyltransferase [Chloroflexi bacterium]|nr:GNAT family N-acetyltransferase [Chloroflexota bacterium]